MQVQSIANIQNLIGGFTEMPLNELESFISGLNALATKKRLTDTNKRSSFLLQKITQTVLSERATERYTFLQDKVELESLSDTEQQELLKLVAQEEKIRNRRFRYLLELAQLKDITLTELSSQLGLTTLSNA